MPKGKWRPVTREGRSTGPAGPSHPMLEPQWFDRAFEREDPDWEAWDECRMCACTEVSACAQGCSWVIERVWVGEPLCSACEELMEAWPGLRVCDGLGIAAAWAFNPLPEMPAYEP